MPVLPGDRRAAWDRSVLADPRVTNLWDANALFGRWFQTHEGTFWDAYLLFGPEAKWRGEPAGMISWGSTIISASDQLRHDLLPLLRLR